MKYVLIGKDSLSCHEVTALVYSPANISDPEGLTCWHHFIHLVENERRVPRSFTIMSHLASFLSLLVCLTPRAWKVLSPSLSMCVTVTNTHTKIFVRGLFAPQCACPLLKKQQQQTATLLSVRLNPRAAQLRRLPLAGVPPSWAEKGLRCAEWVGRSEEKASGWV